MNIELTFNNGINKEKFNQKRALIKTLKKSKLSRYDSAIFLNNFMQKKKLVKSKENTLIKKIEFSFPNKTIISHKHESRNLPNFKVKQLCKSNSSIHFNKSIKLIRKNKTILNSIRYIDTKNKSYKNSNIFNKTNNLFNEKNNELEKFNFGKTFYFVKLNKTNNFINSYLNRFSQTEKQEKAQKEIIPIIEYDGKIIKNKIPFNTLKHYHRNLFHNNKSNCRCYEEEKEKNDNKNNNYNHSKSMESSSQFNNKIYEYDVIELGGKKNYVATKLTRPQKNNKRENNNLNRSKSLISLNLKEKQDFHYLMKHPFSNTYFCSSFINQLTENNNNSYTNNFSDKFLNLNNPLSDKDLTDKLHHLILNPNTSKIRNGELLLMYQKFPKGFFNNFLKKNNNHIYELLYKEELKKLEKTKYRKYIIKLNKTMKKAKNIQRKLNAYIYTNKNS